MTQAMTGASAPLPFKTTAAGELPSASEWLLAILLCAALFAALVWLLRRQQGKPQWGRQTSLLKVLDRQQLGPQQQLVVLQYQGRQLLLSVGPGGTQCLRDEPMAPKNHAGEAVPSDGTGEAGP